MERNNWDAIVIGAGAAGSVFARELTAAGLSVLMLESGPAYDDHMNQFAENELAMWERAWDNGGYTHSGGAFTGAPNLGYGVGGGTLVWTSISLRFFAHDFRLRSTYGDIPGANVKDWPIGLDDLESYYTKAEAQMGVSGGPTPWDPPGRPPLPNPPFGYYRSSALLERGMSALGIRSAPGAVAVNSKPYQERAECVHCGFCRSGCRIDAKYQCDRALLDEAMATGKLEIRTGVIATRIEMGSSARKAKGVFFRDKHSGETGFAFGKTIFLANNPIEIPRLLLNSSSSKHPRGLGNNHDQVGRNFFCHPALIGLGVLDECVNGSVGYNMGNVLTLDFCTPDAGADYATGFSFQSLNGSGAGVLAVDPYRHLWGRALKSAMHNYNNSIFAIAFCEGLPVESNRITVDADRLDEFGIPRAHIHYQLHENDRKVFAQALTSTRAILSAAGSREVHVTDTPFESHPAGTMRMGSSPLDSATDSFGRIHGLANVFVGGSALFVSGSSVNPTLTLHALALRTTDHVKAQFQHICAVQD